MPTSYLPVLAALGFALFLGGAILLLSNFVGSNTGGRAKLSAYESG